MTTTTARVDYAPTRLGDSLAWELAEWVGYSAYTRSVCAGLVRYANRLHNLQVAECNGHPMRESLHADSPRWQWDIVEAFDAALPERIAACEARLESLAFALPFPDETGAAWPLTLQGDPRGRVAYLTTPTDREVTVERGRGLA